MRVGGMIGATLQVLRRNSKVPPIKADKAVGTNAMRQDVVAIGTRDKSKPSGKSKALELIDSLNEQIKGIKESKNALIHETLEAGKDLKEVDPKLKSFDEQIKNIGDMIIKISAEEREKAKSEEEKPVEEKEPVTKEEAESKKLNNVVSLAASVENAEQLASLKVKTEAYARTIASQIKMDKQMVYHHNDGSTQPISAAPKEELLAGLEQSAANLSSTTRQILGEVQQAVDSTNNIKPEDNLDKLDKLDMLDMLTDVDGKQEGEAGSAADKPSNAIATNAANVLASKVSIYKDMQNKTLITPSTGKIIFNASA